MAQTTPPKSQTDGQLLWGEAQANVGGARQAAKSLLEAGQAPSHDLATGRAFFVRLFSYARPYRVRLGSGLVLVTLGALVALASNLILKDLIDSLKAGDSNRFTQATLIFLGLNALSVGLSVLSGYLLMVVGMRAIMDLRLQLYQHLQRLSIGFYADRRTGELVSRVMNDVAAVRSVLTSDLAGLLRQVVVFFGGLSWIIYKYWKLTLIMLITVPVVSLFSIVLGRAMRRLSIQVSDEFAGATTVLEETISGVRTVRSFVREKHETQRFRSRLARLMAISLKQVYLQIIFGPTLTFLFIATTTIIIWFGGQEVLAGRHTTGDLVVFIGLTGSIGGSIRFVGALWTRIQSVLGTLDRIFRLLDEKPTIVDAEDATDLEKIDGRLTFDNLSFAYTGAETKTLDQISIDVRPGETLAIVGPSGAGKTTLANLVPRFFDPTEGEVRIDGRDIRTVTAHSLRQQIGLVPQETHLFAGSIRENLLYGKLDASEEEMIEAASAANAHEFIAKFPKGYDTVVGERGVKVSGGQRQRIAIARALLKNPRILILDEATSALDTEKETLVQKALDRLMINRTSLVIAHRLSTVKNADRIAVLADGKLVETGTHEDLLAKDGLYTRLHQQGLRDQDSPLDTGL